MSKPVRGPFRSVIPPLILVLGALSPVTLASAQNAPDSAVASTVAGPVGGAPTGLPPGTVLAGQTYADLVDLALSSPVVARAVIHRQTRLKPEESPGLQAGFVRLYIEADTAALLVGPDLGESLRFLTDVPLDEKGKVPKLIKSQVLLFGNVVPGKPGELQLRAADTMFAWSPELEARTRTILTDLASPDAPPRVTGLREALHVPGNLTGEGESQFFFATADGKPVSVSVIRRPGEPTRWGVSFSEIVDQSAKPPRPDTLPWYRLACALPHSVPDHASISSTDADKAIAIEDYAFMLRALGPCRRNRPH